MIILSLKMVGLVAEYAARFRSDAMKPWIGVDLDKTLVTYNGEYPTVKRIGSPIPVSVDFVRGLLAAGECVKIFTARVSPVGYSLLEIGENRLAIKKWCVEMFGQELEITCCKDRYTKAIYDDIAVPVEANKGIKA